MLTFSALATGGLIQIEDLAALPKEARPKCVCVACDRHLIAKLGKIKQHHFAHTPDATCYAATGEGALHLSAKLQLQTILSQMASRAETLHLRSSCGDCRKPLPLDVLSLQSTDEIQVEKQYHQFRPDLQLSRDGHVLFVFEIVVTHQCSEEKWQTFLQKGTHAIEIDARDILGDEHTTPWRPPTALPFDREANLPPKGLCASCKRKKERREEEARRAAIPKKERHAIMVCHVEQRFHSGKRIRHCLAVSALFLAKEFVSARLVTKKGDILKEWDRSTTEAALDQETKAVAKEWARSLGNRKLFVLDVFDGFQKLIRHPSADRYPDATSGLHKQESIAMSLAPEPEYWWDPTSNTWVKSYSLEAVRRRVGNTCIPGDFERWVREGKFPTITVQWEKGKGRQKRVDAARADIFLLAREKIIAAQQQNYYL